MRTEEPKRVRIADTPLEQWGCMLPLALLAAALLVCAAWFVWPTPYRAYRIAGERVRVSRLTGRTEVLAPSGWRAIPPSLVPWPKSSPLPPGEGPHPERSRADSGAVVAR